MKVGIMQPYFFPYLGYFSLMKHTDRFILFDTVQFIRHGWIERNRILKPMIEGWQYIRVPLQKHARHTLIKDILIDNTIGWRERIIAQLQHYKKKAPYYSTTLDLIKDIFSDDFLDIVSLNHAVLRKTNAHIGIKKDIEIFSRMNIQIDPVEAPGEWALNICRSIGNVHEYWNPLGGIKIFDPVKYKQNDIQLKFHSVKSKEYFQNRYLFEPGLSIIDVLMFNSKEEINNMLDNYELV
ncbi:MAG: WbqC family protein [Tannerella sp.]|nr:WbqC family protein [Tannerella sp.]